MNTLSLFSFLENTKILVKKVFCVKINIQHQRRNVMFAKNMQYLRGLKGLTQKQLADALFVSDKTVSKWETGLTEPNIDMLKQISRYFDISVDDLVAKDLSLADMTQKAKCRYSKDIKKIIAINMAVIIGYLLSLVLYVGLSEEKYNYLGQGKIYVGIVLYFVIAIISCIFLYIVFSGMWKSLDKTNIVERKSFFKALFLSIALLLYTACNTLFGEHNIYSMTSNIPYTMCMTLFCGLLIVLICSECYMNFVYKDKTVRNCTVYTIMQTLTAVILIPTTLYLYSNGSVADASDPDITQAVLDQAYKYQQYAVAIEVVLGILLVVLPLVYWLIKDKKFDGISFAHIFKNFVTNMVLSISAFLINESYIDQKLIWIYLAVFLLNAIYYIVLFKLHKKRYSLD